MLKSYLDLNFEVIKKTHKSSYGNGNEIKLVNLGPIDLFGNFLLTISQGKLLEDIRRNQIFSLRYLLVPSAKDNDDNLSGFHRNRDRRQLEITNIKKIKGNFPLRILLEDVFGFAGHQKKLFMVSVIN